jgi:single-stranded-DNA-specific exonuclease
MDIPQSLKSGFTASDFMLEALARRGISTPAAARAFLDFHQYSPASPDAFADISKSVERIMSAVKNREVVGIWGDFDVDGQTSTALLVKTMQILGADLRYHIPIRSRESHGINLPALKEFLTPAMKVVISCDTGISAHEAADFLKSQQVDLIITDHHSLPDILPEAFSVINPHLLPPEHVFSSLAGVGVAYVLSEALLNASGNAEEAGNLHDLVALGCIADMASLTSETRYFVQSGLDRMRSVPRPFLSRMAGMLDLPLDRINEEHVSFSIAPRMNAVGRLDDANPMVEMLLAKDEAVIRPILDRMEALNANRRVLVNQVFEGCRAQLENNPTLLDQPLVILTHPEWPAGVVGIAAGRMAELIHRPVILMTAGADGILRGSARSVEGIDITAALASNQQLLAGFGGHPMAAGMSLPVENLPEFRLRMQQSVAKQAEAYQVVPELQLEGELPLDKVDFDLLDDLDRLSPFGIGNPAPVFSASHLTISNVATLGKSSEHRKVTVIDSSGNPFEILWWQGADLPIPEGSLDLAYTAHLNLYKGSTKIQFEWVDARPSEKIEITLSGKSRPSLLFHDRRGVTSVDAALLSELSQTGAQIWCEGIQAPLESAVDRLHLRKNPELIILTIPPSISILQAAIGRVKPSAVTFMAIPPAVQSLKELLQVVGKMLKAAASSENRSVHLPSAAAQLAVTEEWIKTGIQWFAARGDLHAEAVGTNILRITLGGMTDPAKMSHLELQLKKQFEEMAAFRRYYLSSSLSDLAGQRLD